MKNVTINSASFRDPSGFVFRGDDGKLYRQINRCYQEDYRVLNESGLFCELVDQRLLVDHDEVSIDFAVGDEAIAVVQPRLLDFISYGYEWAFSALKDAALLTLDVQRRAIARGMTLKDASHFNVQFENACPIFIDTLSFERYTPGEPWVAYGQFCRHFLAPLALMAHRDISLGRLLALHLDGIPLDLTASLLPWRTRLSPRLLMHVHLQAKMVRRYSDTHGQPQSSSKMKVSKNGLTALVDSLRKTIENLTWKARGTEWADYYNNHSYSDDSFQQKKQTVSQMLTEVAPSAVWDLGANTGVFSQLAASLGAKTYAFDIDPACVERNYLDCRDQERRNMQPLLLDLTNPTPPIGWAHLERQAFADRAPADLVMALALIHHLAIANNVPLDVIIRFFHRLGDHLIIEFVPKEDPQVVRLLRGRRDIFDRYHQEEFEARLNDYFDLLQSQAVGTDGRVIYLCKARRN